MPGLRLDHVAVYGTILIGLPLLLNRLRFSVAAAGVLLLLLAWLAISVLGSALPPAYAPSVAGGLVAGIDNVALPIATILSVHLWLSTGTPRPAALTAAARTLVLVACLNSILALVSTSVDLSDRLEIFWGSAVEESVAYQAQLLGRYSGVFNQPAEAGLFYSVALLAAIYVLTARRVILIPACALITLGGILSVSKVFILVGFPLALLQMLHRRGRAGSRLSAVLPFAALLLLAFVTLFERWEGGARFLSLLTPGSGDLLKTYSAGRFGSEGSIGRDAALVVDESLLFGFGSAGLDVPYDTQWLEALVISGVVGCALVAFVFALLVRGWIATRRWQQADEAVLGLCLLFLAAGASLGLSALTANRAGPALWVLLTLTVLAREPTELPVVQAHARACASRPPSPVGPPHTRSGRPNVNTLSNTNEVPG